MVEAREEVTKRRGCGPAKVATGTGRGWREGTGTSILSVCLWLPGASEETSKTGTVGCGDDCGGGDSDGAARRQDQQQRDSWHRARRGCVGWRCARASSCEAYGAGRGERERRRFRWCGAGASGCGADGAGRGERERRRFGCVGWRGARASGWWAADAGRGERERWRCG